MLKIKVKEGYVLFANNKTYTTENDIFEIEEEKIKNQAWKVNIIDKKRKIKAIKEEKVFNRAISESNNR